jgi:membrane-bound lytic murein transglycosylase D
MVILLRTALVAASLLLAAHLEGPGEAQAESLAFPSHSSYPADPRPFSDVLEEAAWRADGPAGLGGDPDVVHAPVKQADLDEGSSALEVIIPGPPAALSAAYATPGPTPAVKAGGPTYEVEDNHHVRHFLERFQTGYRRAVIESWLARSGRYLPMILDVFRQKGLPDELVFTAMIESGFNPVAVSRAGAKGLWQFMAPTARRYGLRVDDWLDERLDPEKSTIAAARHLLDLYAVFGSWNLVQAAYNAGEMKVLQAIRAMGTSDFWALRRGGVLKDETKDFIPAIQAATLIAREPERYGFVFTPADPLTYELVSVPKATSLKWAADVSGVPFEALERLNPELRMKQTPPDRSYDLKVPVGSARAVLAALEREASPPRITTARAGNHRTKTVAKVHVVKPRETMSGIAKQYGVSAGDLARWNDLQHGAVLRPGDRLRLTSAARSSEGQGGFR